MGFVAVLSTLLSLLGAEVTYQAYNPASGDIVTATTAARGLLTIEGIRFMYTGVVADFMGFNAVGIIIIAMVGVGVAEESGLVKALIRKLVIIAPPKALTYILVFVGIISSIAPNGSVRWAAVNCLGSKISPFAVVRPANSFPYQLARTLSGSSSPGGGQGV